MMTLEGFQDYVQYLKEQQGNKNFISCLLFVSADDKNNSVVRSILDNIQYYHLMSGNSITFFMPGYSQTLLSPNNKNESAYFEIACYCRFIKDFEEHCKWHHSGQTEMFFINMVDGELDFSHVYNYPLESMIREGLYESFSEIFTSLRTAIEQGCKLRLFGNFVRQSLDEVMRIFEERSGLLRACRRIDFFRPHDYSLRRTKNKYNKIKEDYYDNNI